MEPETWQSLNNPGSPLFRFRAVRLGRLQNWYLMISLTSTQEPKTEVERGSVTIVLWCVSSVRKAGRGTPGIKVS